MATDNTVTLIGNLTDDPELRSTANGAAVANFRLAVTPRVRQGDQWTDGETSFFRITCCGSSRRTSPRPSARAPGPS
jgi:single-strand DNA-binding protein